MCARCARAPRPHHERRDVGQQALLRLDEAGAELRVVEDGGVVQLGGQRQQRACAGGHGEGMGAWHISAGARQGRRSQQQRAVRPRLRWCEHDCPETQGNSWHMLPARRGGRGAAARGKQGRAAHRMRPCNRGAGAACRAPKTRQTSTEGPGWGLQRQTRPNHCHLEQLASPVEPTGEHHWLGTRGGTGQAPCPPVLRTHAPGAAPAGTPHRVLRFPAGTAVPGWAAPSSPPTRWAAPPSAGCPTGRAAAATQTATCRAARPRSCSRRRGSAGWPAASAASAAGLQQAWAGRDGSGD